MAWAEQRLGHERAKGAYAWRSVLDARVPLAFGSDFPIESPDPRLGLYAARTRQDAKGWPEGGWFPEQRLSGEQALEAFTVGAAFASFAEGERGRLVPGMDADFTALSVDPVDSHKKWINDINETQSTTVNFPIIADPDRKVSELYDMIHPNANATLTVRSVFVIDPNKKIRLTITYPASTGRNFDEILRVIDSLQLTDKYSVATPVNWKDGEDVIIVPSLQDPELIKQKFPKGYKAIKPYLRVTPQPNR